MSLENTNKIQQILTMYSIAIDSNAPELFYRCFSADAKIDLGGVEISSVNEYVELCKNALPTFNALHHSLSLPCIHVTGNTAASRCYFTAHHIKNDLLPNNCLVVGGWYDDRWECTNNQWRIVERAGVPMWYQGNVEILGEHMVDVIHANQQRNHTRSWLEAL